MVALEGFQDVSDLLRCGVYALVLRGVVVYVGKSKSLYARIYAHRNLNRKQRKGQAIPDWLPVKGMRFDAVFIHPCSLEEIDEVEARMINRYKPKYNDKLKNGLKVSEHVVVQINGFSIPLNAPTPGPRLASRRI